MVAHSDLTSPSLSPSTDPDILTSTSASYIHNISCVSIWSWSYKLEETYNVYLSESDLFALITSYNLIPALSPEWAIKKTSNKQQQRLVKMWSKKNTYGCKLVQLHGDLY